MHTKFQLRLSFLSLVLLLGSLLLAAAENRVPPELKDLGRAHKVRLIYLVPKDREPTPHYAEKIRNVMTFVADVYREDARRRGWVGHELDFFFENGEVQVVSHKSELLNSEFDNTQLNSSKQWPIISKEITKVFGSPSEQMYVVFAETYGEGPAKFEWPGGIALGARYSADGGLGVFSAWILRDEFCATNTTEQLKLFDDETSIQGRTALSHGRLNSPRYQFIEDGFGAVAHELGHALGLPHDLRNNDEYVMGNGFRNLRRNYLADEFEKPRVGFSDANAGLLRWSRFLYSDPNGNEDIQAPDANLKFDEVPTAGDKQLSLRLRASDESAMGAVTIFSQSQGSVVGGRDLEGHSVDEVLVIDVEEIKHGIYIVKANVIDRAGNITTVAARHLVE